MRKLTFKGFLEKYLRELSGHDTLSINKLTQEANQNARLVAPLVLYAVCTGKVGLLLRATSKSAFDVRYISVIMHYSESELARHFSKKDENIPDEYRKVFKAYMSQRNRVQADNKLKDLMRKKVLKLMRAKDVSMYRICQELNLNQGNMFAFLKRGELNMVSLDNARRVLNYLS